ncbi:hypothetical protein K493DRAFT_363564 [Basidiobolus meristosporus CBS 931.73]|uniref:Uncharacterized protein n=1 Tax=Basidiobolus meristosporus CBS 931.73 TaxID=1314790 RepID=A0A1Y1WTJ6_9FUNG|nr:hypothetical protein K493DRAFT_363564 [Basidiobolus meristosporus CBS 931.73]|eukprot:ORX76869.1 hypothetical protein K493DRAFT_363564 [Basidiobolus meristosporus CBS 931.73]
MRTAALVIAFFGLAVSATQFSLQCGSSAQKCASALSLAQGWPNYTNCKSCSLIQCSD